uniref:Hypothetical chloroplast RF1 n=1 Tax=Chloropicon primus TaxID=1764295 RepID=A0A088CKI5_9CHLO|nr:hypothetical chloroplast RF1 [Chloropicon primus]
MSLVTIVKDTTNYVQFLIQEPFPLAFTHVLGWLLSKCVSFLSFKWLINLPLFPIFIPKLSTQVIQEGLNLTSTDQSFENLGFFPAAQSSWNKLLPGVLNSFFLVLPFSPARILWIRRLVVQGIPAGISSGLGLILGQFIFLAVVMFGFRPILGIWSALEPFSFLIGLVWFLVIFDELCSKKATPVDWDNKKLCIQLFSQSLFLGCVEQTTLGQYLSGLTTTSESFFNEGFDSTGHFQFYLGQFTYLVGIGLGLCAFGGLFGWTLWKGSQLWYQTSSLPYQMWKMQRVNPLLILIYGSTILSSIPYYSWDYLFAKPLGFIPDDKGIDRISSNWVGVKSDPQLPRWRDYYMRVSGGEAGILGDGWVWSRYDKADYPASRKRRALEAMLISHEWFPHWAKDRGLLNMEYWPAQPNILKRFSRKIGSLTVPGGDRMRDLIWPKDRRERTIARDSIRGVKNWSPNRLNKLQIFWGNIKKSKGVTRSELLQASRYLTFGRLRSLPVSKEDTINPFVDIESKRTLGNDSLGPMVSTWVEKTRVNQGINSLDEEFSIFGENGSFPVSVKKRKNSISDLWLATRSQVIPEFKTKSQEFKKFHKYWVVRNLLKPRIVQWRLKPSEENYLWMAEQGVQGKNRGEDFSFLSEEAKKLKSNESNLLRLQHYLEVSKKLSGKVSSESGANSKTSLEPSGYSQAFKPLKLESPPSNTISIQRNRIKYRRNVIKKRRYAPRVRNKRLGGANFSSAGLKRRNIIFGFRKPRFLQTRESQRKGDRRLWRRRAPLRPSPVGPSRWSSFNYYRQQVYHQALAHVVDNVMKGQPRDYYLTTEEEKALTKRKVQLARYYDSLRSYQKSPRFQRFVPGGSRTFTDGVYNHQFKGTLSYARRLFYVTPLAAQNMEGGRVYKMSQLLYDRNSENPMLHEELNSSNSEKQPFLELLPTPSPFYTGWDSNDHKMVLTSRTLPRIGAGYRVPSMEGSFTAWPYNTEQIRKLGRPRVFVRDKKNVERRRMAFAWDWKNLQVGFSWRTTPRKPSWYDHSKEEAINTKAPLGYWARAQNRQVFQKKSLRRRRWNRWYLRIPALPRLGGFSWDA